MRLRLSLAALEAKWVSWIDKNRALSNEWNEQFGSIPHAPPLETSEFNYMILKTQLKEKPILLKNTGLEVRYNEQDGLYLVWPIVIRKH